MRYLTLFLVATGFALIAPTLHAERPDFGPMTQLVSSGSATVVSTALPVITYQTTCANGVCTAPLRRVVRAVARPIVVAHSGRSMDYSSCGSASCAASAQPMRRWRIFRRSFFRGSCR